MTMDVASALTGGFVLGFAGSFHCACMCGGIATGAVMLVDPKNPRDRLAALVTLQAGRVAFYALAGAIFAGAAGMTIMPSLTSGTYKIAQWLSAAALMWVGLSMAGLLPRLALPGPHGQGALATAANRVLAPMRGHPHLMPLALGATWGMTPCPMVYAALIPSALTGSVAGGASWMLGFGLGTVPAVLGTALGLTTLTRIRRWRGAEVVAGLAVAAFGLSSVTAVWPAIAHLCGLR